MKLTLFSCRYWTEGVVDPIAVTAGIVQTGLYLDFFYVYFTRCARRSRSVASLTLRSLL
jgi:hypothetical protein